MAAGRSHYEARRQLRINHGRRGDRTEPRLGAGTAAQGIQRVAPWQEQEHNQPRT